MVSPLEPLEAEHCLHSLGCSRLRGKGKGSAVCLFPSVWACSQTEAKSKWKKNPPLNTAHWISNADPHLVIDRASDIPLAVRSESTAISSTLSLCLSSDTSTLSCSRPSELHIQPTWRRETRRQRRGRQGKGREGVKRGVKKQSERRRVRSDGGNLRDSEKVGMEKSDGGFERSPEKALRSYLAESIRPHRMQLPLCSESNHGSR